MTGKKKEGFGTLKETSGGQRREDRQLLGKTSFDPITIDAKSAVTALHMLNSPEDNVLVRALASLDSYATKVPENVKNLAAHGIFKFLFPLIHHKDNLIQRFTLKLIGMLCAEEEFRDQMVEEENVLNTFTEILEKSQDTVLHEYAALTLAELTKKYQTASELLSMKNCIEILFSRITSLDPDVEKNCLDVMNHLLNDVNGIEAFIESPAFDIKLILALVTSSYPVIQATAIEVLKQLTSWCRDTRVLIAFRDAQGTELMLNILEKEEWFDLHNAALIVLLNVVDSPELSDYLVRSGCLGRLLNLMEVDLEESQVEKILGVLARMSQTHKGCLALHTVDAEKSFCEHLENENESFLETVCLGIANLAKVKICEESIMRVNPVHSLLSIVINPKDSFDVRNMAGYALNVLCNVNKQAAESVLDHRKFDDLILLLSECHDVPSEVCQNVIQMFIGISTYDDLRIKVISENFLRALISRLPNRNETIAKDPTLQVDALECLAEYLAEASARSIFDELGGASVIIRCLKSKFASVREWGGHLVVIGSQSKDFVKYFILNNGLEWMMREKNTMYSMPSWQAGVEAIFCSCLSAKFAYTGRLDFQDIIQDEFYISANPTNKFILLDHFMKAQITPLNPIYVANMDPASILLGYQKDSIDTHAPKRGESRKFLDELMRPRSYVSFSYGGSVKMNDSDMNIDCIFPDPYLCEYTENLKKRLEKEELPFGDYGWQCIHPKAIAERARIIGKFVSEEMAGPETDPVCSSHYKEMHINELKYHLGSNIIPLGFIRMGSYLERAMLFKVLADRIGFPCAFVRGMHGRAWVEVAIPVINIEDSEDDTTISDLEICPTKTSRTPHESTMVLNSAEGEDNDFDIDEEDISEEFWFPKLKSEAFKAFPKCFLKPTAIVDLIGEPGRLLRINSVEADEYRGAFLFDER